MAFVIRDKEKNNDLEFFLQYNDDGEIELCITDEDDITLPWKVAKISEGSLVLISGLAPSYLPGLNLDEDGYIEIVKE